MSSSLTIDGKEYVLATVARKEFDYTKDYLLLLIKQGKIDGKKIANRWYVHVPSARKFFEEAKTNQSVRGEKIRKERLVELEARSSHTEKKISSRTAVVETFAILVIGLSLGAAGYVSSTTNLGSLAFADKGFFERTAISFYALFSDGKQMVAGIDSAGVSLSGTTTIEAITSVQNGLVVMQESQVNSEDFKKIQESFSDEVGIALDPANPNTGVVIPKFKNRDGEAYRFLLVPVTTQEDL